MNLESHLLLRFPPLLSASSWSSSLSFSRARSLSLHFPLLTPILPSVHWLVRWSEGLKRTPVRADGIEDGKKILHLQFSSKETSTVSINCGVCQSWGGLSKCYTIKWRMFIHVKRVHLWLIDLDPKSFLKMTLLKKEKLPFRLTQKKLTF